MRLKKKVNPVKEAAFIDAAKADEAERPTAIPLPPKLVESAPEKSATSIPPAEPVNEDGDPHQFVHRTGWPILESLNPYFADGRDDLDKPFIMRMKENLWLSIDRHCKALGVDKSKWIRQAILNQLAAEQQHFLNQNLN